MMLLKIKVSTYSSSDCICMPDIFVMCLHSCLRDFDSISFLFETRVNIGGTMQHDHVTDVSAFDSRWLK